MKRVYIAFENHCVKWMREHGLKWLRYSIAIVFIWFGFLKVIGFSPATQLVAQTVYWADPSWFVPFLGGWEMLIGACFLWRRAVPAALLLLAPQMMGTVLPLFLLPHITWQGFLMPTIEGQYIIKNLLIISGALVLGAHIHDKKELA